MGCRNRDRLSHRSNTIAGDVIEHEFKDWDDFDNIGAVEEYWDHLETMNDEEFWEDDFEDNYDDDFEDDFEDDGVWQHRYD